MFCLFFLDNNGNVFRWNIGGIVGGVVVLVFAIILIVAIACTRRRASPRSGLIIITHSRSQQRRGNIFV